jgi:hypothetical protein
MSLHSLSAVIGLGLAGLLGLGAAGDVPAAPTPNWVAPPACHGVKVTLLRGPDGGRVDWRPDGQAIAFDHRQHGALCYDIMQMKPDGAGATCLTCGKHDLPPGTKGNPAWYPDGRFIVFQGEEAAHAGPQCGFFTGPGSGVFNDLWVMNVATGQSRKLYSPPPTQFAACSTRTFLRTARSCCGRRYTAPPTATLILAPASSR